MKDKIRPDIGIDERGLDEICESLKNILADVFTVYVKVRNYHWNVVGTQFNDLHSFFQKIYETLNDDIDEIAERIRKLGQRAPSTLKEFLERTKIKEHPGEYPDDNTMLRNILYDLQTVVKNMRGYIKVAEKYNDYSTADFLTDLISEYEKISWMIRAILEK